MIEIIHVGKGIQLKIIKELFIEYNNSLGIDLEFQNFNEEYSNLPGDYSEPGGSLILILQDNFPVGCAALRKFSEDICELKRMYVRLPFRGKGIGKEILVTLINEAKSKGYIKIRLDTLPFMKEAITLYRSAGFYEIEPYRFNPVEGALFFELNLK